MRRLIFAIFLLTFISCNSNNAKHEEAVQPGHSDNLENAKWYFYCYASPLQVYLTGSREISPLECEVTVNVVRRISIDTINIYLNLSYKDTSNICVTKPLSLVGVARIKSELYLPIYHMVRFDSPGNDSAILAVMSIHERMLTEKIKEDPEKVVRWLRNRSKQ